MRQSVGRESGVHNKRRTEKVRERENRREALALWETLNTHVMVATAGTVLVEMPPVGDSRVVSWTEGSEVR